MTRLATHQWWLVKCVYDIDQQVEMLRKMEEEVMSSYDAEKAMLSVQGNLAVNVHFFGTAFKHPKFSEEKEWRAIKGGGRSSIRPGTSTLIPYANFPLAFDSKDRVELRRLVVGPTPHASLGIKAAQMLLEQTKTVCPEVVSSEIPFRNW